MRFLLINSFHDSMIKKLAYSRKNKTLTLRILSHGVDSEMELKFNAANYDFLDIDKIVKLANKFGLDAYSIVPNLVKDGKIWIDFEFTSYDPSDEAKELKESIASEAWYISFICESLEISGG